MFLVSSCSCLCQIHWSQVLSREWRRSWSSADRRCSNSIWVINNFIANWGAAYSRGVTVTELTFNNYNMWFGDFHKVCDLKCTFLVVVKIDRPIPSRLLYLTLHLHHPLPNSPVSQRISPSGEQPEQRISSWVITTNCRSCGNISQILLLYKTWGY